jgi:hypothetical protein
MRPELSGDYDEMEFAINSESARLINIASYANLTGYFVLAGVIDTFYSFFLQ